MMEVKAVISPNKLGALRATLLDMPGFPGMTVSKVEGYSVPSKMGKATIKDELTDYSAKVRIEIICNEEIGSSLMDKIVTVCQIGQMGDGVVWCASVPKIFFIAKAAS